MSAFTSRLNEDVKLVGSTISCEGSPLHGKRSGRWRRNPHVQSYAVATDQVGGPVCVSVYAQQALNALSVHVVVELSCP
jgi:hypothetical protein